VAIEKAIIALAALAIIALAIIAVDLVDSSKIFSPTGMGSHGQIAESTSSSTETTQLPTNPNNTISVSGLSLCSSNCGYAAPYASALVMINASVPISTLKVYVNNTYDGLAFQNPSVTTVACSTAAGHICSVLLGGSAYSNATYTSTTRYYATCSVPPNSATCSATNTGSTNTVTVFAYEYKGSVPSKFIPTVPGAKYIFTFVATFQDGSTATATASTFAS